MSGAMDRAASDDAGRLLRRATIVAVALALTACGRAPTEDMLPGGIPARTDLHQASTLPPQSVRTVNRRNAGWRVIFHPAAAPAGAEQGAAHALCGLERKRPVQIIELPLDGPTDDPGARKIDIVCG